MRVCGAARHRTVVRRETGCQGKHCFRTDFGQQHGLCESDRDIKTCMRTISCRRTGLDTHISTAWWCGCVNQTFVFPNSVSQKVDSVAMLND
jgi:hypothetical protein